MNKIEELENKWMWMILCINIITDNENKKDRMIIAYPSIIM